MSPPRTAGAPVTGTIATFAGSDAGDGGPATNATLREPESIAVTSLGDVYVLDSTRCRIRKVSGGIITNAAGNGACAYSADGSVATSSPALPTAVAVGPDGSLYFTEASNSYADSCRVRKVVAGLLTTVAGNGICGSPVNGAGATGTPLQYPTMLAVDGSGNAYVSGITDCRVWKIVPGGVVTHVVGDKCGVSFDANPLTAWITPVSIAVDSAGVNIYVAENDGWSQCYIVRVSGGALSQFAGAGLCGFAADGPVAGARIAPRDIEVGSTGDLFFVDGCSARKVSGATLSTVATCVSGPTPYLLGLAPHRLAVRGTGEVWMADIKYCRIAHLNGTAVETVAGGPDCNSVGDGGLAVHATLSSPRAVGVDGANIVYVADSNNCRVRAVAAGVVSTVAGAACGGGSYPPIGVGVPATEAPVWPRAMAVTPSGDAYITDAACRLRVISGGLITTIAGSGGCGLTIADGMAVGAVQFDEMAGIAVSPAGTVYLSDRCRIWSVAAGVVHLIAGDGTCSSSGDGGAAASAELNEPFGLAIHNGDLYLAERDGCRVRKISGGIITTVAGDPTATSCGFGGDGGAATSGQLNHPTNVAVDSAGVLYIGDMGNCRVRKVESGTISTVAGNGTCGFGGDGGPATLASLATPIPGPPDLQVLGVAVDASQNVYIADPGNERVRIVYSADSDGDGYTNAQELALGKDPLLYCGIMRADVNMDGKVTLTDLILTAQQYNQAIPPGTARFDQNADGKITLADLILEAQRYNQSVSACP